MGIVPGEEPAPRTKEPLLNEEPVPPGVEDYYDEVEELEKRVRERGPEEVEQADEQADAAEGDGEHDEPHTDA